MCRLLVFFGCMVTCAFAEVFDFADIRMPNNLSMTSHYLFHVLSTAVGSQEKPRASVTFKDLEIKWSDGKVGIGDYKSLQVLLIPLSKFGNFAETTRFCSAEQTIIFKEGFEIIVFTVGTQNEASFPIKATDEYLLAVSNCGNRNGLTMSKGEVIVKQPHGYLPGNKIWTQQWWGWFTLINAIFFIVWAIAAARHCKVLVFVQKAIASCAMAALLEAGATYVWYKQWNETGTSSFEFQAAPMFCYSLKYVLTLRILLETAEGSGVIMERLETSLSLKMDAVCVVFLTSQWIWKMILSYKYRFLLKPSFLLTITVPGTLLWLFLFIWVYRKFHVLLPQMQQKKLGSEAVTVFINMRMVLVGSILLATVVLLIQCADILTSATPWNLQWLPYDACPHSVYTLFLLALMILWWPNADSWKLGYSDQVTQDEDETAGVGKVEAAQIGVAEAEEL